MNEVDCWRVRVLKRKEIRSDERVREEERRQRKRDCDQKRERRLLKEMRKGRRKEGATLNGQKCERTVGRQEQRLNSVLSVSQEDEKVLPIWHIIIFIIKKLHIEQVPDETQINPILIRFKHMKNNKRNVEKNVEILKYFPGRANLASIRHGTFLGWKAGDAVESPPQHLTRIRVHGIRSLRVDWKCEHFLIAKSESWRPVTRTEWYPFQFVSSTMWKLNYKKCNNKLKY